MRKGFTLIEVLVAIALVSIIAAWSSVVGIELYRRNLVRDDAAYIAMQLQKAREKSMHGICATKLCIHPPTYGVEASAYSVCMHQNESEAGCFQTYSLESLARLNTMPSISYSTEGTISHDSILLLQDDYSDEWNILVRTTGTVSIALRAHE